MSILKIILCAVSLTSTVANGYNISFSEYGTNRDIRTGQLLGSWSGGSDAGCRTDYLDLASVVYVTSGENDEQIVSFFKSDDCDGEDVVNVSEGTRIVTDFYGWKFRSFKVVDGPKRKKQSPTHGELFKMQGETFRYHQIAHGMWRGVPPEEWDDNAHVRNDTVLDAPETVEGDEL